MIPGIQSTMNGMNIAKAGLAGGIIMFILMVISGFLVNLVMPSDLSQYGGMRPMNDPVMNFFYLYPFIVAFATAFVFDIVQDCLKGSAVQKGLTYAGILFAVMTVPSLYVMYTSMTWPLDFYLSTAIWEIVSFPLIGVLFAKVWKV